MEKTNVMRVLDQKKVSYVSHSYVDTDAISGVEVAKVLNQDPNQVFKTLVTIGKTRTNYVFVIPVEKELDLKKAASFLKEKKIEMIKQKELFPLTGYIHGGCSPIGMKKKFVTYFDESIKKFDEIYPVETSVFGTLEYNATANVIPVGNKVSILIFDINSDATRGQTSGTFGYFYAYDLYKDTYSNEKHIFYIDDYFTKNATEYIYSTLAHEFQHMLNHINKKIKKGGKT